MRIDQFITEHKIYQSRERAQRAIKEGAVSYLGKKILKPSFQLEGDDETILRNLKCEADPVPYVSRGGFKLISALEHFNISVVGLECVDVGASTGGFTEVLLQNGAKHVHAIDVGHDQLADELRQNSKVTSLEGTDARKFALESGLKFDFLSMDVSFISITKLAESVRLLLRDDGRAVILYKPQFEVGSHNIGRGGIVKSTEIALSKMKDVISVYEALGFTINGTMISPIKGGDGNTEYLIYMSI